MALNRSDKSRILRRYFPGMTRNSEMSTEPRKCRQSKNIGLQASVSVIPANAGMTVNMMTLPKILH